MDKQSPENPQELLTSADNTVSLGIHTEVEMFSDQVLQAMVLVVNEIKELLRTIDIFLLDPSRDDNKFYALILIRKLIIQTGFESSSINIKYQELLINCVKDTSHAVCSQAIDMIADMCFNKNSKCQEYFIQNGIIELLTSYLSNDDLELVASALFALAALITVDYGLGLALFMSIGGVKYLASCLHMESSVVFCRACSMILTISGEYSFVKDYFAQLNIIKNLTKKLHIVDGYEYETDLALQIMAILLESRYCNPQPDEIKHITEILKSIIENNEHFPDNKDIVYHSKCVLKQLESRTLPSDAYHKSD